MSSDKQKQQDISEWYQQYGDAIFKYILMMIRDYQQAEDLTQETFIKAYKFYDSYDHKANQKSWLFSVARNTTIDYIRKRKPIYIIKEFFLRTKKDDTPLPDEVVLMRENAHELYSVLAAMKSTYREVIILRKIKGFSIRETSEILKWSDGKVRTTLSRAITELETRLIEEGNSNEKTI